MMESKIVFRIVGRILFGLIVIFLSLSGALRLFEHNSDIYRHEIEPYCDKKGILAWGYECDYSDYRKDVEARPLENYTFNHSEDMVES